MPAIVYLYHLPSDDPDKNPDSEQLLQWHGTDPESGEPATLRVVPHLIDTLVDEQLVLRTIAPRINEVAAVQIFRKNLLPRTGYIIRNARSLPLTYMGYNFQPDPTYYSVIMGGTCTVQGVSVGVESYQTVLLPSQVAKTEHSPFLKCYNQVQVARIKQAIQRRERGERDVRYETPANQTNSCFVIGSKNFEVFMADLALKAEKRMGRDPYADPYDAKLPEFGPGAKVRNIPPEPAQYSVLKEDHSIPANDRAANDAAPPYRPAAPAIDSEAYARMIARRLGERDFD